MTEQRAVLVTGAARGIGRLDAVVANAGLQHIEPEEVADAVAYVLGPGGRAMTGVPLTMDLGGTVR
jgi:hypothetical protein